MLVISSGKIDVLKTIRDYGPIPRYEISEYTNLTRAAVTDICSDLIDDDIVEEVSLVDTGISVRGRPPVPLDLKKQSWLFVGVQIAKKSIKIGLLDLKGNLLHFYNEDIDSQSLGISYISIILAIIKKVYSTYSRGYKEKIVGMGIGAPGIVDNENGIIVSNPYVGLNNVNIKEIIEEDMNIPVVASHNVYAMAWGERFFGLGRVNPDFVIVYWNTGIGSAICLNGKPYKSSQPGTGQIGHVSIDRNGKKCWCGNKGCLETLASEDTVIKKVGLYTGKNNLNRQALYELIENKDEDTLAVIKEVSYYVGDVISNLLTILGPELVVINGSFAKMGDLVIDTISSVIENYSHPELRKAAKVKISPLGDKMGVIGAASLIMNEIIYKQNNDFSNYM